MKNTENTKKAYYFFLGENYLKKAEFSSKDDKEAKADKGIIVIMKKEMTALELAGTIGSLSRLTNDLIDILVNTCGYCDNCGEDDEDICDNCIDCDDCTDCCYQEEFSPIRWMGNCPFFREIFDESQKIQIPDNIKEISGIPLNAKLQAITEEGSGEVVITEAEIQQDISDIPKEVIAVLSTFGICFATLNDLIMDDCIIYGNRES